MSIGWISVAFFAGYIPDRTPVNAEITKDIKGPEIDMVKGSLKTLRMITVPVNPAKTPIAPPLRAIKEASIRN